MRETIVRGQAGWRNVISQMTPIPCTKALVGNVSDYLTAPPPGYLRPMVTTEERHQSAAYPPRDLLEN